MVVSPQATPWYNAKNAAFGRCIAHVPFITRARGVSTELHGSGIEEGKGLEVRLRHMGA
jgi:hypothetical protein